MGGFVSNVRDVAAAAKKAVCDAASALSASIARAARAVASFFSSLLRAVASFFSSLFRAAASAAASAYEATKRAAAAAIAFFSSKEGKIFAAVAVAVVAGLCLAWCFAPAAGGAMMAAPGAGGLMIPRFVFEANAALYFSLLRFAGPAAAVASAQLPLPLLLALFTAV